VKALKERPQLKLDVPSCSRRVSTSAEPPRDCARNCWRERKTPARAETPGYRRRDGAQRSPKALSAARGSVPRRIWAGGTAARRRRGAAGGPKAKETPAYEAAIADLNAALINHIECGCRLEALGKQRAQRFRMRCCRMAGSMRRACSSSRAAEARQRRQGQGEVGGEVSGGAGGPPASHAARIVQPPM